MTPDPQLMPSRLKVGPAVFRVKTSTSMDDYGSTDPKNSRIRIAGWQSPDQQAATLLHEALHAVMFVAGASKLLALDHDAEERLVSLLEPWLRALLIDNPGLVAYLLTDFTSKGSGGAA